MRSWRISRVVVFAAGLAVGVTFSWAGGPSEFQTEVNSGLVNAANSVLQNLLGSSAASIRGFNPQPDPPRVVMHVNDATAIATDFVVFRRSDSSSACENIALVSVVNGTVTLTRDTNAALELETADLNLGTLPPGPSCPEPESE